MSARAIVAPDTGSGARPIHPWPHRANRKSALLCLPVRIACEELIQSCWRDWADLQRHAVMLLGDPAAAEDVLQDVFVQLLERLPAGDGIRNRRAWLFRVVRNACLLRLRRQHRQAEVELPLETRCAIVNPEVGYQRRRLTHQLIGHLTPRELACVRLRAEGFSYAEIARSLDIRPGTVGALLSRATAKCRLLLSEVPASRNGSAVPTSIPARRPLQAASTGAASLV